MPLTLSKGILRPSATASINCPWISSRTPWRISRSSLPTPRYIEARSLYRPLLITSLLTPIFSIRSLKLAISMMTPIEPVIVAWLAIIFEAGDDM
ncbi:hypothetical protein MBAV_000361 [Candidatus Magnetobacterium bavaricum]|uniref:Uncharacterized protein n=1 Tax=Candidatus Magnetobacterium bavaricum TaxID=29290 RepID=A0A0F3H028_9BACT|nr:hypothetical protein MBAV_000361 [Candidatus Magnetobacterium bavaricum]